MSYLVLARKSRPRTFDEVIGQQAVVRTLQNALSQNRVPHALIFSGVRGVGKTTLARIMAKALNCEQGPTATPCNQCRSCREIMSGVSVDLHEVDGASNRGIQEIREMKEQIRFMPTGSRFKIIIIDEVHMLTSEAFNALLKTIEEPPEHVYFMFATTEMHRVPVTILSRCQRYELKRVGSRDLTAHFSAIAASEKVEIEPAALNLIVREARGSVRDGLSLLDQIFSYCGDAVSADEVVDVLGLVSHRIIAGLASSLLAGDLAAALGQLDQVYTYGMDLKRFINDLLAWFRDLVVCRVSSKPEQ
ncbi:MAG TPA: DNA polymerase III subunit gamma/tau, partial [Desulfobacteraceae bacterium]|nr:DNA polymerase III subunit gamma/tau [Desulfobacteraceae bacterium]